MLAIDALLLNDDTKIKNFLQRAAVELGYTSHEYSSHAFSPQGLSATLILSESHMAVHTWPEHGNAYLVIATCGQVNEQQGAILERVVGELLGGTIREQETRRN